MILDYDELIAYYNNSLHSQLRSFSTGHAFLETWVPDEDASRSLFGIFEAADVAGLSGELTVRLSPKTAALLDKNWLESQTSAFGDLAVESRPDGVSLRFTFGKGDAPVARFGAFRQSGQGKGGAQATRAANSRDGEVDLEARLQASLGREVENVHPLYLAKVRAASLAIDHEGELPPQTGKHRLETILSGLKLSLALDARTVIVAARHAGATGLNQALLDRFCASIEGLSLQEASEHGIIRLERELRSEGSAAPVPGILTPESGEPAFATPTRLIREIFKAWAQRSGQAPRRNFWTDPLPLAWLEADASTRLERARAAIDEALSRLQVPAGMIRLREIQRDTRVVVEFEGRDAEKKAGPLLLRLERMMRESLRVPLELFLAEREDTNKPREQNVKDKTDRVIRPEA